MIIRYNLGSNSAGDLHRLEESPVTTPGGGRHERRESRGKFIVKTTVSVVLQ